ncbi:MAG: site-specific DNA-methyltransferase [Phycisphaerae bacterium]|jgi:adenine-specific DNA-methyltransferase|nr:site-specific DNA-methyltransferase [Phycisphaerae bacterium]MCC7171509.1 site-specific DNA-methyltransferase [Planctomycetota bacterium]
MIHPAPDHQIRQLLEGPFPVVRLPGIEIAQADCLAVMRGLPDCCADLIVTSPPYNIGKEYEHRRTLDDYLAWCREWLRELHRIARPSASFWLNLGYCEVAQRGRAVPLPYLMWDLSPFYLLQEVVWHYGAGVASRLAFSPRNEKFLWFVKDADSYTFNLDAVRDPDVKYPKQKKNGKLKCNPLGKNPGDVWYFPKVTSGANRASPERTAHPAQFPLAVIDRIVKACSNPGDLVFDPFMGSGTTAEAASANDRTVAGSEMRADYVKIARDRLMRAIRRRESERSQLHLVLGE